MKQLLCSVVFILSGLNAWGQMVVTDPGVEAVLGSFVQDAVIKTQAIINGINDQLDAILLPITGPAEIIENAIGSVKEYYNELVGLYDQAVLTGERVLSFHEEVATAFESAYDFDWDSITPLGAATLTNGLEDAKVQLLADTKRFLDDLDAVTEVAKEKRVLIAGRSGGNVFSLINEKLGTLILQQEESRDMLRLQLNHELIEMNEGIVGDKLNEIEDSRLYESVGGTIPNLLFRDSSTVRDVNPLIENRYGSQSKTNKAALDLILREASDE